MVILTSILQKFLHSGMSFSVHALGKSIPRESAKILKVEINLSILKFVYLDLFELDLDKLCLKI